MRTALTRAIIIGIMSFSMIAGSIFFTPSIASACGKNGADTKILGFPFWYEYLELDSECNIVGPLDSQSKFNWPVAVGYVAIAVIEIMLRLAGMIAVGYVIYGGFRFITAQGEPENAKAARETIQNAVIGLVIAIVATAVVNFIGNKLTS